MDQNLFSKDGKQLSHPKLLVGWDLLFNLPPTANISDPILN